MLSKCLSLVVAWRGHMCWCVHGVNSAQSGCYGCRPQHLRHRNSLEWGKTVLVVALMV
jgi:hypothetical protein